MNSVLGFGIVAFATMLGGWFLVSRYFRSSDAVRIKDLIERYQTEQFRPAR